MTVRTTSLLVAVVLSTAALPGCVTSPNWGDSPSSRRDAIDFTGMASRANAPLRVQAWNYTTSTFDTVRSFTGSATRLATSPDLYGWSTNTVVLPDRYWSPGGCESSGMANLRVLEVNTDGTTSELATFTEAGMDCVNDHLGEGDHPVVAGNACRYPEPRIVLTTPVQCPFPNLADITAPQLSIRLADPTRVWQATSGGSELTAAGITRTTTMTATARLRDAESTAAEVRLIADLNLQCRNAAGSTLLSPRGFVEPRTQAVVAGTRSQISLDATRGISISGLISACPSGTTFVRLDGAILADGRNGAGAFAASPVIRFTVL
ncbi:MAG: hypothetical protein KBG48_01955 [Kofleriaceae bacterium]|jgi:hypothetical protein|nr:hypothetical protein [Kofleriaceae bacterium]MBP9166112.1 hypothetical protein [Kofleriaceae bacterium]MBP9856942.1 hypothetical protein [Kofleriaceae bacterium]